MKIIKRIVFILVSLFFLLLLSYNVYKFVCVNILKKEIVTINGYVAFDVVSGSMEPTIHIGDMIIVDTKIKKYKKGDIVTYYDSEGSLVTHRILSINKKEMITKGDNNNIEDKPVAVKNIVGKFVYKVPKGQRIISSLKSPLIMTLILINGVLFCIFVSIDRHGNLVLDEEEKEYEEFKEYLNIKNEKNK